MGVVWSLDLDVEYIEFIDERQCDVALYCALVPGTQNLVTGLTFEEVYEATRKAYYGAIVRSPDPPPDENTSVAVGEPPVTTCPRSANLAPDEDR